MGVIKRGKSTLLNALLEAETDILSTHVTPETARLSYLIYALEPSAIIHTTDQQQITISINELPFYTSTFDTVSPKGNEDKVKKTLYAEILYPNEILKRGFSIVDTPGVDDPDESRSNVTLNFIDKADAVIFLMNAAEGGLKDSELKFLENKILNNTGSSKGIVCVMNMIARLRPRQLNNELPKLIEKNEILINKTFGTKLKIFPIDALDALNGIRRNDPELYEKSRFGAFKDHLESYLVEEKGKIFLRIRISKFLQQELKLEIERLQKIASEKPTSLSELENNLALSKKELEGLDDKAQKLLKKYSDEKDSILIWMRKEISSVFNSSVTISPSKLTHLVKDINTASAQLAERIAQRTDKFISNLTTDFELENLKISKPNFMVKPKQINISEYYSVKKVKTSLSDDTMWKKVGRAIGILLEVIFNQQFITDGDGRYSKKVKYDEVGLKNEIDNVKLALQKSFQSKIDYYFDDISENVNGIIRDKRKNLGITYKSQRMILKNELKSLDDYRKEISSMATVLNSYKQKFEKLLIEVDNI